FMRFASADVSSELMLSADAQEMLLTVTKMLTCLFFDWYGSHTRRPDGVHLDQFVFWLNFKKCSLFKMIQY
ncbi:MAG: hypothetical protein ABJF11_11950, partial [Reichenbachiella sp.]|uniref:hypothetical protein n=1 Tax=Reichenbachiella sp. TaxID=2184521 RepID=UPI0032634C46